MKKIFAILISFALLFGMTACSGSGSQDSPDFEAKNIQWISAASATKDSRVDSFATVCEKDHAVVTEGTVNIYSAPCDAPEGFKTPDGYAWQKLNMRITFGDENANESGYRYCYLMTDYYDMAKLQSSLAYDESKQCDTFTVRWNDKKYKKCVAIINKTAEDWVMDEESGLQSCSEILSWTLLLPEGYDGICCGIYSAALEGKVETVSAFTENYDPASFVLYRLDAVK